MTAQEIIDEVKKLRFPDGEYVVFGSCPMALAGIREAGDVDLLVSEKLFKELETAGWEVREKAPNDNPLVKGDFEAHADWGFSSYRPTLKQLLSGATVAQGVPFARLEEVRKWKAASGRPKDLKDVRLIDDFLAGSP